MQGIKNSLTSRPYLILAAITLFSAGLRFYRLGQWSFWYDEIYTLRSISNLADSSIFEIPVSRVLISSALIFFGTSEWSARFVPAIIGILTVPILYFPVKKIFGSSVALLSSLFLAVSPWHLYWSQNARFYTTLLLFYTLALYFFFFAVESNRLRYWLVFLIFMVLAVQERLFSLFLVPVIVLYLVLLKILPFEKPSWLKFRYLLILLVPGLILGLIFGWEFIQDPAQWLIGFGRINNNPFWIFSGVAYYVGIPVLLMGTTGAIYSLLKKERSTLLLAVAAVFPLVAIMVISIFQYSANRYIFVTLTSWIVLASLAVYYLYQNVGRPGKILAVGILLILVLEPLGEDILYYQYQNGNRENWKAAFQLIERHKLPGDRVAVSEPLLGDYYLEDKTVSMRGMDLDAIATKGDRVWFVVDNSIGNTIPNVLQWIEKNASFVADFDVPVRARTFIVRVYLYDPSQSGREPSLYESTCTTLPSLPGNPSARQGGRSCTSFF